MIAWILGPVDEILSENLRSRVPRVANLGYAHSSVVGDGATCLSYVRGVDLSLLDRECKQLFETTYEDQDEILRRTIGEMGWEAAKQEKLDSLMKELGVDTRKHSSSSRLGDIANDVGRVLSPTVVDVSLLYTAGDIPRMRELPRGLAEDPGDTFVEASTIALTAHTPTGAGAGTGWTEEARTGTVSQRVNAATDRAEATGAEASDYHVYSIQPNPSSAEYDISMTAPNASTITTTPYWLIARWAAGPTCYGAGTYRASDANDKQIWKIVAGVATQLAQTDSGIANGDTLLFEVRNGTKTLYKNGVSQINTSDNAITAAGRVGYGMGNLFVAADDIGANWDFKPFSYTEVAAAGNPWYFYTRRRR